MKKAISKKIKSIVSAKTAGASIGGIGGIYGLYLAARIFCMDPVDEIRSEQEDIKNRIKKIEFIINAAVE